MKEIKIVEARNAALMEQELAKYFNAGFGLLGNLVVTPNGLVQMLYRELKQPEKQAEPLGDDE
ncbi:MAG: hypothetical protein L3J74_08080 [Bacteroidales bacterium]|nr:hypothetical protein [Bacteroidales bacterium]